MKTRDSELHKSKEMMRQVPHYSATGLIRALSQEQKHALDNDLYDFCTTIFWAGNQLLLKMLL